MYRFASYISLPAINLAQVGDLLEHYKNQGGNKQGAGLLGLLSSFTGGAFSHASVMALGIMPYISASIIVQLMGMAIPYLQKLQKDGESGRNTLNQITRWLTIGVCLVQAPSYLTSITQLFLPYAQFPVCILCRANFYHVLVAKYCNLGRRFSIRNVVG
ncbi:preprotein translocase subunit SecY [Chryseobacterium ginsenosidimutans]|nr:preprotein translocase subunit SecY [Chryseobacterium ginsenosidimutans]